MGVFVLPDGRVVEGEIHHGLKFGELGELTGMPAHGPVNRILLDKPDASGMWVHFKRPWAKPTAQVKWLWYNSYIEYRVLHTKDTIEKIEREYYPLYMVDVLEKGAFCGSCGSTPSVFHWRLPDDFLCIHCRQSVT